MFDLHGSLGKHFDWDFGNTSDTIPNRGLLFAQDGSRLFTASPGGMRVFLTPGISGTVVNSLATPLAGVHVDTISTGGTKIAGGVTDSSGYFSIPRTSFTSGQVYKLRYTSSPCPRLRAGTAPGEVEATAGSAATFSFNADRGQPADLTLAAPGTGSGHLTDGHGTPVAGVHVSFIRAGAVVATGSTDASGAFSVSDLVPGDYQVALDDPAWASSGHDSGYVPEWFGVPGVLRSRDRSVVRHPVRRCLGPRHADAGIARLRPEPTRTGK